MLQQKLEEFARIDRKLFDEINEAIVITSDVDTSHVVTEERIINVYKDVSTRVLLTHSTEFDGQKLPIYLNMHGGGFIEGRADFDTKYVEITAAQVPCMVLNLDYKVSPEYKFPTALEEAYGTVLWAIEHAEELNLDPTKIAVGGHSAGAGLSVSLSLLNRDRQGFPLAGILVDYPPVDMLRPNMLTELEGEFRKSAINGAFFNTCYLTNDVDRFNLFASPILLQDGAGLPPMLMITGDKDPLTGPAKRYADILIASGVDVEYHCFPDCRHGFVTLPANGTKEGFDGAWKLRRSYLAKLFA